VSLGFDPAQSGDPPAKVTRSFEFTAINPGFYLYHYAVPMAATMAARVIYSMARQSDLPA
jgi:hypothetical protein